MVASINLPFTFGEEPRFITFMLNYAQPTYQSIPKITSRNDTIKSYENKKLLIIKEFDNFFFFW